MAIILRTPVEIRNASVQIFPEAKIKVLYVDNKWQVEVRLPRIAPFNIAYYVDRVRFEKELDIANRMLSSLGSRSSQINVGSFLTQVAIEGCKKYNQQKIEQKNKHCFSILIKYFETNDPEYLRKLKNLGLAPEQLINFEPEDLVHFRPIVNSLENMEENDKKHQIINALRDRYPLIFEALLREKSEELRIAPNHTAQEYENLLNEIQQKVIGQPEAVKAVAQTIAASKANSQNKSFLFVGPTGVGKTELARSIVRHNRMVFLSMEKYQEQHSHASLFGSPAGYVGSTDKPLLAKEFDRCGARENNRANGEEVHLVKETVLLFDEFEKAHTDVKQSLLHLLETFECHVQYTEGNKNKNIKYKLQDCFIIATSNLFQNEILTAFQNNLPIDRISEIFKQLNNRSATPNRYSPELMGRVRIIPFGPIPRGPENYHKIIKLRLYPYLQRLAKQFEVQEIRLENEGLFLELFEQRVYGEGVDIRRLEREWFPRIESSIFDNINGWGDTKSVKLILSCENGQIFLKGERVIKAFNTSMPLANEHGTVKILIFS